jgi:cell division protein FtsN
VKDYKPRARVKPTNIGNTLLGIFVGLLLGLLVAAAIAVYMMKSPFPWSSKSRLADRPTASDARSGSARTAAETDRAGGNAEKSPSEQAKVAKAGEKSDKPHFDFYRILPGQEGAPAPSPDAAKTQPSRGDGAKADMAKAETPKAETAKAETAKAESAKAESAKMDTAPARDNFLLQVGSFQNPAEADNVKAKLALMGLESNIETVDLPDKGTWYRVRMGPYRSLSEVNRIRSQLAQSGIDVALVRNNPAP